MFKLKCDNNRRISNKNESSNELGTHYPHLVESIYTYIYALGIYRDRRDDVNGCMLNRNFLTSKFLIYPPFKFKIHYPYRLSAAYLVSL